MKLYRLRRIINKRKRFSSDSIEYCRCNGTTLLGWDYPYNQGLREIMQKEKMFPVTVLDQLTKKQKIQLIMQGVVSCNQLTLNLKLLSDLAINGKKLYHIEQELDDILNYQIK